MLHDIMCTQKAMFYSLVICKEDFQIEMFFQFSYTIMSNNSLYKCCLDITF